MVKYRFFINSLSFVLIQKRQKIKPEENLAKIISSTLNYLNSLRCRFVQTADSFTLFRRYFYARTSYGVPLVAALAWIGGFAMLWWKLQHIPTLGRDT